MKKAEVGCCHGNNGSLLIVTPGLVLLHHQSSTAPQCRVYVVALFYFLFLVHQCEGCHCGFFQVLRGLPGGQKNISAFFSSQNLKVSLSCFF